MKSSATSTLAAVKLPGLQANIVYAPIATAINPAYIVLAGLGSSCILLVIIGVITLCCYPMREKMNLTHTLDDKEISQIRTRRPKALPYNDAQLTDRGGSTLDGKGEPLERYTNVDPRADGQVSRDNVATDGATRNAESRYANANSENSYESNIRGNEEEYL